MYGIVPITKFPLLLQYYKVLSQVFKNGNNDNPVRLPFVLLEDDFDAAQTAEILAQSGQVFGDANDYNEWKEAQ